MKEINFKTNKKLLSLQIITVLGGMLLWANLSVAAVPALFLEQSSAITGARDTLAASRVPVRNSSGVINYYDIVFKLELNSSGVPVLAPFFPTVAQSSPLISAGFKAGSYKDSFGNVYQVTGPTVAAAGRSSWSILMTKASTSCPACTFQGSWTTGPIAGHPLQTKITGQGITLSPYSWGTINSNTNQNSLYYYCSANNYIVGFAQIGNQMDLHGYCHGNNVESNLFTLNLCTTASPCP